MKIHDFMVLVKCNLGIGSAYDLSLNLYTFDSSIKTNIDSHSPY